MLYLYYVLFLIYHFTIFTIIRFCILCLYPDIVVQLKADIYCYDIFDDLDTPFRDFGCCFINCYFLAMGLDPIYRQKSVKLSVDFWELDYFRNLMLGRLGLGFLFFKQAVIS